jgi:4'-phosphopantetheinyl transferase
MVKIYCIKLEEHINEGIFNSILDRFSAYEKEKTLKYVREIDRERRLIGRLLVWWVLVQDFKFNKHPEIIYDQNGRPLLKNKIFDFNISHSGKWVAIGISEKNRIGIDVQEFTKFDINEVLHYFSDQEINNLNSISVESDKKSRFFQIWTLKEAYIKCIGSTFKIPLNKFWFSFNDGEQNPVFSSHQFDQDIYKFKSQKLDDLHWLSVCITNSINGVEFKTLDMTTLLNSAYEYF